MKILLVHNYYRASEPSGEKQVLELERELLRDNGHEVREYARHSDEIIGQGIKGLLKGAIATPWNPFSAKAVANVVEEFTPDIVHVHNTFPLISPSIYRSIGSRAARVLTLHNYRLFCPAAIPMREGNVCTDCIQEHSVRPAVKHGCYRNSRLATLPLALNVALHRWIKTWVNDVDAFIVLSEFQKQLMCEAGLPRELVHVKPNFLKGMPQILSWEEREPSVLYVGRLSEEKGVEFLIRAWIEWGESAPELRIIGDGPLQGKMRALSKLHPQVKIRFFGQLSRDETLQQIAQSSLLVLPSIWFETFGMVILEAFAHGTPVAVSDIGPLSSIVQHDQNGLVFPPANHQALLEVVCSAWNSKDRLQTLGSGARESYAARFTEQVNYELMLQVYQNALEVHRERYH